ncbi:hypothetical protein DND132_1602 [Pseudodesulfovibrio mercurii]|uniref:Solute-binding protein family 3/N-terminal domain-containing protein n=1 Tax=Pseudodesulfovibrio mercurii TaxID=641491 RepID=F0JF08_9BACT|nr:transporter substrate-binding domain-containing protein [Pseudodesulfovibrio mercurii]EGB14809.1 hypothetical protein DND132_1602 [Pseudodesulfovibrio mercurii]
MRKRPTKWAAALSAAVLVVCLTAGFARARGPVLEVGAYLLPPLAELDESGVLRGRSVDGIARVLAAMGYEPRFTVLPFKRCLAGMREGSLALMLPCVSTDERRVYMRFSEPVDYMHTVLWKRGTAPADCWQTLDDLKGLRIGTIQGYYYGPKWQEALAAGTFVVESAMGRDPNRGNFLMLIEDRIDMFVCDRRIGEYLKKENSPRFDDVHACPGEVGERIPLCVPVSLRYFREHDLSPETFLARFNGLLAGFAAP